MPAMKRILNKVISIVICKVKRYYRFYKSSRMHWTERQAEKRKRFKALMKQNLKG